jgi:arginyl-tRNA synthetase
MISDNPFAQFQFACEALLKDAINRLYPDFQLPSILLQVPPNLEFGELAASVCFELAKYAKNNPRTIAEELIQSIDANRFSLVESVQAAGAGYINFHVNSELFSRLTLESIRTLGVNYGYVKTSNPQKILLEHTSVNPVHPIHVGQARNPMLGDALARILKEHGHNVSRHYYVDDVGRQSAVIATVT